LDAIEQLELAAEQAAIEEAAAGEAADAAS
jgi:hypothetical protein